jgi:hypothetical protein
MDLDLTALSAILARTDYNVRLGEPGHGATEPRDAEPCRCDRPGLYLDPDGDVRCWKCGAYPATACRR